MDVIPCRSFNGPDVRKRQSGGFGPVQGARIKRDIIFHQYIPLRFGNGIRAASAALIGESCRPAVARFQAE